MIESKSKYQSSLGFWDLSGSAAPFRCFDALCIVKRSDATATAGVLFFTMTLNLLLAKMREREDGVVTKKKYNKTRVKQPPSKIDGILTSIIINGSFQPYGIFGPQDLLDFLYVSKLPIELFELVGTWKITNGAIVE